MLTAPPKNSTPSSKVLYTSTFSMVVPEPTALKVMPFSSLSGATSKPVCLTTT